MILISGLGIPVVMCLCFSQYDVHCSSPKLRGYLLRGLGDKVCRSFGSPFSVIAIDLILKII